MQSRELVKLYYRIGEVSEIVGVQPHVLRYWETEFRSIRPQKSSKGQRVYSRRDVEKLLKVKDLLKNQGFTIAGARKRLSESSAGSGSEPGPVQSAAAQALSVEAVSHERGSLEAVSLDAAPLQRGLGEVAPAGLVELEHGAKSMRRVLLGLRQELVRMLDEISENKAP